MDYGEVLSRAWKIIWRYKVLWLFGILAGCGSSGISSVPNSLNFTFEGNQPLYLQVPQLQLSGAQWAVLGVGLFFLFLGLIILAVFLNITGYTGVIHGAHQAETSGERMGLGDLFSDSLRYFWRLVGLTLLLIAVIILASLGFALFTLAGAVVTFGLILICLVPLACVLVPVVFILSIFIEQSTIAIIVDNLGVFAGIRRGWEITWRNLGAMIVMGLILYIGVYGIIGFIIILPLFFIIGPLILSLIISSGRTMYGSLLITGLCLVAYLPVLILLNGMLQSYVLSAWTLTYLRLSKTSEVLKNSEV